MTLRIFLNIFCSLLISIAVTSCSFQSDGGKCSTKFLISQGYYGWIHVEYGIDGSPQLPVEQGSYLIKVSTTNHIVTSSLISNMHRNEFFYYSKYGTKELRQSLKTSCGRDNMIWADFCSRTADENSPQSKEDIFVGTEEQYRKLSSIEGWPVNLCRNP